MTSAQLARVIFRHLQGTWKLERTLKSTNTFEPSGKCYGSASFSPRPVTNVEGQVAVEEMLYEEHGDFEISLPGNTGYSNPRLTFSRKYIWRLGAQEEPSISVWFTKPGTEELDYLFHEQDLGATTCCDSSFVTSAAQAHGSHLCVDDLYETNYHYDLIDAAQFEEATISQWSTSHTVKGPKKDQLITTNFTQKTLMVQR
jgi:Family of unknown function (DUF6314)